MTVAFGHQRDARDGREGTQRAVGVDRRSLDTARIADIIRMVNASEDVKVAADHPARMSVACGRQGDRDGREGTQRAVGIDTRTLDAVWTAVVQAPDEIEMVPDHRARMAAAARRQGGTWNGREARQRAIRADGRLLDTAQGARRANAA